MRNKEGLVTNQVEVYNVTKDTWELREDLTMQEGRFSFCAVPGMKKSVMMVMIG